ncbi:sorting nexin-25 [Condylostylus longicornis]|uniref:sorting nexin-25 n=1 Tax=Condylostylus longicornis TaxID=2530218 RepID=UPI00244E2C2E|nr:sorting nexin-25 [Condylostylus longicornis]
MNLTIWLAGSFSVLFGLIWYYPTFLYIFLFGLYSLILVSAAVTSTLYLQHVISTKPKTKDHPQRLNVLYNATKSSIFDPPNPISNPNNLPLIFGRTVDLQLQQLIEFSLKDFVTPWLKQVVTKPKNLSDVLREDIWNGIQKLRERSIKIDSPKVIAVDMVNRITVHLEKIRITNSRALETGTTPMFATNSYLQSEERELEFLRKLTEIVIIFLLPRGYSLSPLKILLSEILSYKIFFPMIKMITSPDYINQKIVQYIEQRLAAQAMNKRTHEYAASFEDILKIIQNSTNTDELLHIRTSIINDLMHATTMQNLQRSKGLDPDKEDNCLSRSEVSAALRLKRYVQQLTFAKSQCEKNLSKFGWDGHFTNDLNLSLLDILSTVVGRRYLTLFLEPLKASALVGYYTAVEELKHSSKLSWHQLGAEIFYTYIRVPMSEINIDKSDRKKIETFLLGDTGPDVFYDIQKNIFKTLEEKYYPPFLLSDQYRQLKDNLTSDDFKDISNFVNESQDENQTTSLETECTTMDFTNHSSYARNKLEQLHERLENKNQAFEALKSSVKPESKVLGILEKEVEWLRGEKRQIEAHLLRTEIWSDYLGKWKADIQSVDISEDKDVPQFMILVHVNQDIHSSANGTHQNGYNDSENISTGWVVLRSLTQFHELHRKLRPLSQELKSYELPTTFKLFFLKSDKNSLEKAKAQSQKYLNFILEDEHLSQSEAIYTFLSPSSEHLKYSTPSPKKSKFSLSTLFKIDSSKSDSTNNKDPFWGGLSGCREDDDLSIYLDSSNSNDTDGKFHIDIDSKDSIAEPLYALMSEIFDMGGLFTWLRKKLISFVQLTYGRTINRQIRESISYLFEESMLHFYVSTALKSFWPGGILASSYPVRSDDMKEMTTNAAKALLADNIPEVLCNLLGAQTAKHGIFKVFDALQNPMYNKQLFYEFIEIFMLELFPEIRQLKPTIPKTNSNLKQ